MTVPLSEYDRVFAITNDVRDGISHADKDVRGVHDPAELVSLAVLWDEVVRDASATRDGIHNLAGERMSDWRITTDGKIWQRTRVRSRTNWRNGDLLQAVLDTRYANPVTGEIAIETGLDKVRQVWSLAGYNARPGVLRERGLDPDDFCEMEERGWKIAPARKP